MTDFKSIHARCVKNEHILRSLLDSMVGAEASALVQLISTYDRTVESVLALTLFLNERDNADLPDDIDDWPDADDVDDGPPDMYNIAPSSLHDMLDGEGDEKRWEQLVRDNPFLKGFIDPPDGVV